MEARNDLTLRVTPGDSAAWWTVRIRSEHETWEEAEGGAVELSDDQLRRAGWLQQYPSSVTARPQGVPAEFVPEEEQSKLAEELWRALPGMVRARVLRSAALGGLRVFVHFDCPDGGIVQMPWEGIPAAIPLAEASAAAKVPEPASPRTIQLVRWRPADPGRLLSHVGQSLRVLVSVASLPVEAPALTEIESILPALRGLKYEVQVAARRAVLARLQLRGLIEPGRCRDVDQEPLVQLLERGGFHVLHVVGSSNHQDALLFAGGEVDVTSLRDAVARQRDPAVLRLVVFNSCLTSTLFAHPMLTVVDQMVGMGALVPCTLGPVWVKAFYEALRAHGSVGEAVQALRGAIEESALRDLHWVPQHWLRVADDRPFVGADTLALQEHCAAVAEETEGLVGIFAGEEHVPITEVYVELRLDSGRRKDGAIEPDPMEYRRARSGSSFSVDDLLGATWPDHVLLGPPGSGKTTLLRHLAHQCALRRGQDDVPLYANLREWTQEADTHACRVLGQLLAGESDLLRALRALGPRLLVLLDGWDEVDKEHAPAVRDLLHRLQRLFPQARTLVASRVQEYESPDTKRFREATILELDEGQQERLLVRWFGRPGHADEAAARRLAADTRAQIQKSPALRHLARVPLFLTLMAQRVESGHVLARERHQFLDELIDHLVEARHRPEPRVALSPKASARELLEHIAFAMTSQPEDGKVGMRQGRLLQALEAEQATLTFKFPPAESWPGPEEFLERVHRRTRLLAPLSRERDPVWLFPHRMLQEVLTARHLHRALTSAQVRALAERVVQEKRLERWAEVFTHYAGFLTEGRDAWVLKLVGRTETRSLALQVLAAADSVQPDTLGQVLEACAEWRERRIVLESLGTHTLHAEALVPLLARWLDRHWIEDENPVRADGNDLWFLDEALKRMSVGLGLVDGALRQRVPTDRSAFEFVPGKGKERLWKDIPPGEFLMGSPEDEEGRYENEPLFRARVTHGFRIAAVPVTREQFAQFDPSHYQRFDYTQHLPASQVAWFEATMFCRWLGLHLGQAARLPTECEWEWAARGWGGSFQPAPPFAGALDLDYLGWYEANSGGRTHPVGEKQANGLGLYDVHGNVWEWCLDSYGDYPEVQSGVEEDRMGPLSGSVRVKRGGSCGSPARRCRAATRYKTDLVSGWDYDGFRVVLAAAPVFKGR